VASLRLRLGNVDQAQRLVAAALGGLYSPHWITSVGSASLTSIGRAAERHHLPPCAPDEVAVAISDLVGRCRGES
jgi:hypothetical protein